MRVHFRVTPAPATGDISFTFMGGINWEVDIDIDVLSLTLEDTGGAFDGVDRIVFSNLAFDAVDWAAIASGGSIAGTEHEFLFTFNATVPEPSTATLLGLGLVGVGSLSRRRA